MERVALNDQLSLSRLIYGMWRLCDDNDVSPAHVQAKMEICLEQGITTMDLADVYGGYMAEEILGNALRVTPRLRDRIEIVTKCGIVAPVGRHAGASIKHYDTSRAHIGRTVEQSLRLMGIERIDLLLIHRPDPMMDHLETGRTLDQLIADGKVGSIGVSNFKPHDWELLQSAMSGRLATNQIEISLLKNQAFTNGDIAFQQRLGIPPMAWSPLGGGAIFDKEHARLLSALRETAGRFDVDESAVAVAWLLAHPARILPILGTNNPERIAAIGDALKVVMDRPTWYRLYEIARGHGVP